MKEDGRNSLLVITSTFPRWEGDTTPQFVAQFCDYMATAFPRIFVLAPHARNAKRQETKNNVHVTRFRYFYPSSGENIAYDGGALAKMSNNPIYLLKLFLFLTALFLNTLVITMIERIRIINAHWILPQGFVAILVKQLTGARVVVTVHGSDVFSLKGRVLTGFKRFVLRKADHVVVNSVATLQACKEIYRDATYSVIPMGIDTGYFRPRSRPRELIARYGLSKFTILFVGRLSEEKGAMFLFRALKRLKAGGMEFTALIVGDGPQRSSLTAYMLENGLTDDIVFAGWVDHKHMAPYYNAAAVLVGPSLREGFGLVFAEALSSGVPVIATDVGGISEVVLDGKTGYLVQPGSEEAIYKKLVEVYKDNTRTRQMARDGRVYIEREFSWKSVIGRYTKVFRNMEA